jgi:hypothetical protein
VRNIPKDQEPEPETEVQESEAEKRARIAREEREEIMDRLEEEERAQYVFCSIWSEGVADHVGKTEIPEWLH